MENLQTRSDSLKVETCLNSIMKRFIFYLKQDYTIALIYIINILNCPLTRLFLWHCTQ